MSKSIEQQAREVMLPSLCETTMKEFEDALAALSRAGLLVSERDVLCVKLAEPVMAYIIGHGAKWSNVLSAANALRAYDREHAPKPRYTVEEVFVANSLGCDNYRVKDNKRDCTEFAGTRAKCDAVAAALNALAEKEAGR